MKSLMLFSIGILFCLCGCDITRSSTSDKPSFLPSPGVYPGPMEVQISSRSTGVIAYTIDGPGLVPSEDRVIVRTPAIIDVNRTMIITARASEAEQLSSDDVVATYTIQNGQSGIPVFDLPDGFSFARAGGGAFIVFVADVVIYTTDGSDPKSSATAIETEGQSTKQNSAFSYPFGTDHRILSIGFEKNITIKAFTRTRGLVDSDVVEVNYTVGQ